MKKAILVILAIILLASCSSDTDEAKKLTSTYLNLYKFDSTNISINQETLVNNFVDASDGTYTYDEALTILDVIYGSYDYEILNQTLTANSYVSEIQFTNTDFKKIFDEIYEGDTVKIAEFIKTKDQGRFDDYSNNLYVNTFEELDRLSKIEKATQTSTTSFKVTKNDNGVWEVSNEEVKAFEDTINFDFNTTLKDYYSKIQEFINTQ